MSDRTREDSYDAMLRLADLFADTASDLRERARLGQLVLRDEDVAASAELSPITWASAEEEVRAATTGRHGLEAYSTGLDADAVAVRATVLTYRWIDELRATAARTIGSVAARAVGYLAPEVELGGAVVTAGLIETDAEDRDGVVAYLGELADQTPDLMAHVSGAGGLLDGLRLRSLLTTGVVAGADGEAVARGGLAAAGVEPMTADAAAALRDAAGPLLAVADEAATPPGAEAPGPAEAGADPGPDLPRSLEDLMTVLASTTERVAVRRVAEGRYTAYLPGPAGRGRLRLVGGDPSAYTRAVVRAVEQAVAGEAPATVMLVGWGPGGAAAAEIAATRPSDAFEVDQLVVAGAPAAQVPRIPGSTRVLSLEDRGDPVALLGSLVNARATNRLTVVFDAGTGREPDAYVAAGRAADSAGHDAVRAEVARLRELGYLAAPGTPDGAVTPGRARTRPAG